METIDVNAAFEDAHALVEDIIKLVCESRLPAPVIHWALCSVLGGALAAAPNYEKTRELLITQITDLAQYFKENPDHAFFDKSEEGVKHVHKVQ
jgi:hypothetical protein